MPTTMPIGGSSRARKASTPCGSAWWRGPGRPPQSRSGASDHTPTSASSSTTFSSRVSIARKAISTFVTGLPRPVAATFSAAAGASVGAGSGRDSTPAASAAATIAESTAAPTRSMPSGPFRRRRRLAGAQAGGRAQQQDAAQAAADRGLGQRHVDGVRDAPRRGRATARRRRSPPPRRRSRARRSSRPPAQDQRRAPASQVVERFIRRSSLPAGGRSLRRQHGARDELGHRRPGQQHEQPDADQLERAAQAPRLRQQPEHHEAEAEVVRLGERVQSRQRIGETQQSDGARRERRTRPPTRRRSSRCRAQISSALRRARSSPSPRGRPFLTNAMEAKVASSASGQRDVDCCGHAGHRAEQQQRRDAAGPDQLRRHHAVGVCPVRAGCGPAPAPASPG